MPGSFIGFPRDPVTNQTVGLNQQSRMPKLRVPSFLSRKSSEASTTSTASTSSASSTRSTSSIVDIQKQDWLSPRQPSIEGPPAYEYPQSEKPRHPSIMLSPKEAKALAKAQEKARRKAQRAIENEQAMKELKEMDKIMRYAGMAPCSSRLH